MIRALAVDIDGTLTDHKRRICPASIEAIQSLNVPIVLVTGNTHCFTRTMAIVLGTPFVFISENGGVVSLSDNEMEILADLNLCEKAYKELGKIIKLHRHDSRYRFTDITLQRDFDVQVATRQLQAIGLEAELIDTVFAVHIKDARVNKGTGLKRVAKRLQIPLEQFAAVGDSNSDIPMFELVGFRASVGNASSELKAISDYVAEGHYGRGFLEIAKHMNKYRML